jgi:hypothetical protein
MVYVSASVDEYTILGITTNNHQVRPRFFQAYAAVASISYPND